MLCVFLYANLFERITDRHNHVIIITSQFVTRGQIMNTFIKTILIAIILAVLNFTTTACAGFFSTDIFEENHDKIMSYIKDDTIERINRSSYYRVLDPGEGSKLKLKRKWCKEFMGRNICRYEGTFDYTRDHYYNWDAGDGDFYPIGSLEKTRRNVFYFFADIGDAKIQLIHQFFSGDEPLSYLAKKPWPQKLVEQVELHRKWSEDYWGDEVTGTRPKLAHGINNGRGIIFTSK